jgi:hypothetical protein
LVGTVYSSFLGPLECEQFCYNPVSPTLLTILLRTSVVVLIIGLLEEECSSEKDAVEKEAIRGCSCLEILHEAK